MWYLLFIALDRAGTQYIVVIHAVISYNILYAARMKEEEEERKKRKRKASTHTIKTLQNKTILNYPTRHRA